ncbi:hypothetical protein ACH5RR_021778 [Cinchona calisaya]|uniref:Lipoxygenase domain-containing protein n=1 Tax=Cinchona calisaya TaxID=153742 RepID=A0ABD2ZJ42_9GENT
MRDVEFSRQTLAGMNPYSIQLVTEWPLKSKLDPNVYGPAESAITTEIVEQEIKDSTLMPLAIELTRPAIKGKPQWKEVFRPSWNATGEWLWKIAKAHVLAHDSGYHQLVSHWLRTHCCTEPYIIASNRQLSALHPIYRLLHPYLRYTMEINALAREALINGNGIIENSFSPRKISMELCSAAYDLQWQFDHQALPADLISRGMAVEDPNAPHGLKLTIEDFPFANDGLVLWDIIKKWVADYVKHYYPEPKTVQSDQELQSWWTEIRTVGHGDKKDEPWWPVLNTPDDLIGILTTIIWTQATTVMAILDVLSNHSPDEEYIGDVIEPVWAEDPIIKAAFEEFSGRLKELEGIIDGRNADTNLKDRTGAGVVPYRLLKPFSKSGVTGQGVPNSISI